MVKTKRFKARRSSSGTLEVYEKQKKTFFEHIASIDGDLEMTIGPYRSSRSLEQNRYYWGVVIDILSKHLGYYPEEMHEVLGGFFLLENKEVSLKEGSTIIQIVKSTTSLKINEFEQYLSRVREWASIEHSCYIPLPNE